MSKVPSPEELILRHLINRLPRKDKQIWDWYNLDKLTFREIGKNLRISKQAAAQRITRIKRQLKNQVISNTTAYRIIKSRVQDEIDAANYQTVVEEYKNDSRE